MAHIWKNVAITLGFSRANIKGIEMSCHYQPEDATLEMFRQWLKGAHSELKPATWSTLIQSLKDVTKYWQVGMDIMENETLATN